VPRVWKVRDPPSSRVAYHVDKEMVEEGAEWLPCRWPVVFGADRGGADTPLREQLAKLGWQGRLRRKGGCWSEREGKRCCTVTRLPWSAGQALFWHHVSIAKPWSGPVHLAWGRPPDSLEYWGVVSAEPTEPKTCED
jgi:hypothetical protein